MIILGHQGNLYSENGIGAWFQLVSILSTSNNNNLSKVKTFLKTIGN